MLAGLGWVVGGGGCDLVLSGAIAIYTYKGFETDESLQILCKIKKTNLFDKKCPPSGYSPAQVWRKCPGRRRPPLEPD